MSRLQLLWARLTADRTRFAVLCSVTGLGLLLWARLILVSDLPRTAVADPEAGDAAAAADDAAGGEAAPEAGPSAPAAPPVTLRMADEPARDPFVTDPRHFPDPQDPQGLTADGAKSGPASVDDTGAAPTAAVRIASALLRRRLEAAVPSAGLAVVDGRRIGIGEHLVLDEPRVRLRVIEVRQRAVVLVPEGDDDGERFVLRMSGPGG